MGMGGPERQMRAEGRRLIGEAPLLSGRRQSSLRVVSPQASSCLGEG